MLARRFEPPVFGYAQVGAVFSFGASIRRAPRNHLQHEIRGLALPRDHVSFGVPVGLVDYFESYEQILFRRLHLTRSCLSHGYQPDRPLIIRSRPLLDNAATLRRRKVLAHVKGGVIVDHCGGGIVYHWHDD